MLSILFAIALASPVAAQQPPPTSADTSRALQHYQNGWRNLGSELFDQAVSEFRKAIEIDPNFKLAYYGLGRAHMATKAFPDAVRDYEQCRAMYQRQLSDTVQNQFEADRLRQDDLRLISKALQQLGVNRNAAISQNGQVRALQIEQQRLETQQTITSNRTLSDPVPAFVSLALGSAYFRSGRIADAEREYKAAAVADPKSGEAHSNLAVVYLETGRIEEADNEVKAAEKTGFRVNSALKDDIKKKRQKS